MPQRKQTSAKAQALRQSGTLNSRAQEVRDRLFLEEDFFDAHDLAQVKYEMLRRVRREGTRVSQSGFELRLLATFLLQSPRGLYSGGSGRADWQEERPEGAAQAQCGDYGLCGAKANSRSFAQSRCFIGTDSKEVWDPRASTDFGTGFGYREKKTSLNTTESVRSCLAQATELIEQYERLRQQVLCRNLSCGSHIGRAVLVSRGVVAWM